MIRMGFFTIRGNQETLDEIEYNIQNNVETHEMYDGYMKIYLNEESSAYAYLLNKIEKGNLSYSFNESRKYTNKELEEGTYFQVYFSDPWELDGKSEENFNTEYDLSNACPECGRGKVLISDLYAQTSKLKNKDIVALDPSIIVSPKVREIIEENGFSGCGFGMIRDYRTKKASNHLQMCVESILPKMDESARIIRWKSCCGTCHEYKQILESEMIYRAEQLENIQDFNLTQEFFSMGIPAQQLVVSKKVRDTFRKEKIKVLYYEPIRII